jgi:hypothetical protein
MEGLDDLEKEIQFALIESSKRQQTKMDNNQFQNTYQLTGNNDPKSNEVQFNFFSCNHLPL